MKCTWKGCSNEAVLEQFDAQGKSWANLCPVHHGELESALRDFAQGAHPKLALRAWVLAQGGAEAVSKRFFSKVITVGDQPPNDTENDHALMSKCGYLAHIQSGEASRNTPEGHYSRRSTAKRIWGG